MSTRIRLSVSWVPFLLSVGGLLPWLMSCSVMGEENSGEHLLYVLQPELLSTSELGAPAFSWLVLEPTRTGQSDGDFTAAEITQIRDEGPCDKSVLAYLSIGEAEDYREYWDSSWVDASGDPIPGVAPDWLGPANPDWPGNYKVRYWDPEWQALLFGTASGPDRTPLDRIIDQGFDGVYMDIIDAYEYWSSAEGGFELTRMNARALMIDFVEALSAYARQTRAVPDFLVFPQNAADIIRTDDDEFDADTDRYFDAISGIGQEDLFFDELQAQPSAETDYVLEQLYEFRDRGKTVLVTDYVVSADDPTPGTNDARVSAFLSGCWDEAFIPYAAYDNRDLDVIVTLGGAGWTFDQPDAGACLPSMPTLSGWGVTAMSLLLVCGATVVLSQRRPFSRSDSRV